MRLMLNYDKKKYFDKYYRWYSCLYDFSAVSILEIIKT